ncbi:MAG TPA: hypothetical protein DCR55_02535, partial [Lentisphaeria bacterium]|nr:hypothetical protein [Lentisphaeria bacterium]
LIVWDKTIMARPQKGWFRAQCEFAIAATSGSISRSESAADDDPCSVGLFQHRVIQGKNRQHVTEKPVQLMSDLIQTRGDWRTVLDPFMGSGTTLRAAKDLGRKAIGIEIDERYCEIAAKRMSQEVFDFGAAQ